MGKTCRGISTGNFLKMYSGLKTILERRSWLFRYRTKKAGHLPVFFVLTRQLSKYRNLLWDLLILLLFPTLPLPLPTSPQNTSWSCPSECIWVTSEDAEPSYGKSEKRSWFQTPSASVLCAAGGEGCVLPSLSVAGLWFGLSDIQFLHYDGSWRLVVSCSSSLSKRENLVLRVVFKIRSYQQLLAGVLSDGKGRFSLSPAPYHPFPLVQASIELLFGIFCILVNTSSIYCSSLGDENTEQLSIIA